MVLEFTANELSELLNIPVSDLQKNRSQKGRLMQYGMYVFGRAGDCGGCRDAFKQLFYKLKSEGMKALENKINRDFDLKPGYVAQLKFGSSVHISNAVLTNELALEFLSVNKARIKVFTKFPEDWESRVDAFLVDGPAEQVESIPAPEVIESEQVLVEDSTEVINEEINQEIVEQTPEAPKKEVQQKSKHKRGKK
jgi:hypothetical protein